MAHKPQKNTEPTTANNQKTIQNHLAGVVSSEKAGDEPKSSEHHLKRQASSGQPAPKTFTDVLFSTVAATKMNFLIPFNSFSGETKRLDGKMEKDC